jgi:ribosomal protein S18 acetylase RimI-like enzyme
MTVRDLTTADAPALLEFYRTLDQEVTWYYLPFGADVRQETLEDHLRAAETGTHISLGLLDEAQRVLGHVFLWNIRDEKPVFGIGLHQSILGQGWGRRLAETIFARADALRIPLVTLTVLKTNVRACSLYRTLGFETRGVCTMRSTDDSYYMERIAPAR